MMKAIDASTGISFERCPDRVNDLIYRDEENLTWQRSQPRDYRPLPVNAENRRNPTPAPPDKSGRPEGEICVSGCCCENDSRG